MKIKDKTKESQKSTVFCDPKDKEKIKKTSKKRIVIIILAILLAIFVVIPVIVVQVAKVVNNPKKTVTPLANRVEYTVADELAKELYAIKTNSVTDQAATENIVSLLNIKQECGDFTLDFRTDKKPYKLYLCFKTQNDVSRMEDFEALMRKYSCVLMALVSDIEEVGWQYPAYASGEDGGFFNRDDAMKYLGNTPVSYFGSSSEAVQVLLTAFGLEG